jgi:hypothetical protein
VHREQPAEEPDVDSMLQGLGGGGEPAVETPEPSPAGPNIEMDEDLFRSLSGAAEEEGEEGTAAAFSFDMPTESPSPAGGGVSEFEFEPSAPAETDAAAPAVFEPPSFQEFSFDLPEEAGEEQPSPPPLQEPVAQGGGFVAEEVSFSFGEAPLAAPAPSSPEETPAEEPFLSAGIGAEPAPLAFEPSADTEAGGAADVPQQVPPAPEPSGDDFIFGDLAAPAAVDDKFSFAPPAAGAFTPHASPVAPAVEASRAADTDMRTLFSGGGEGGAVSPVTEPLVFGGGDGDEEAMPPLSIASRKRARLSSVMRLLIMLPVLLAVAAGAGWWYVQQNGVAPLEGVLSAVGVDMAPRFELSAVKGVYVAGVDGVQLFVVQGEVKNLSRFARGEIQVRGTLFAAGNRPLMKKMAFCGNPLPPARLATLPLAEMEKAMGNRFGEGLSNLEVRGGASIPFTLVFVSPPMEAVDFGVEMAGSALAQKRSE